MFGKDQMHVDLADLPNSDKVLSFIHTAAGKTITNHTIAGGIEALDVFIANTTANPLPVAEAALTALLDATVAVGLAAAPVPALPLAARRSIQIENIGGKPIYVGASGVTVATGVKLNPGSVWEKECGPSCVVYAISGTAAQEVRVLEFA